MPFYDQQPFDVRCEWGMQGLSKLAPGEIVVIVDILSFCTTVDIAVSRGVTVFPFLMQSDDVEAYARERNAQVADKRLREPGAMTLAPSSMVEAKAGTRLVLPSRNGSVLAFHALDSGAKVVAGSLRNASAVADWVNGRDGSVVVVPGGERWPDDLTLRPSFEDMMGAGAIISRLHGNRSPEAAAMVAAFESASASGLYEAMRNCSSGRELIEAGYEVDIQLAAEFDVSKTVPVLEGDAFVDGAR